MIYIKTDDEALCREMLGGFHDRKPLTVGGSQYVMCDITRNFDPCSGPSVEAKGELITVAAWTGTGLPPVGTVCEMTHENWGNRGWEKVTVNYCSAEYAITIDGNGEQHWHMRNIRFRPIKTQAQIEAEARDAAAIEMWNSVERLRDKPFSFIDIMGALYDNGYRLTKQDGE